MVGGGVSTRYSVRLCCTSYRKQRRQLGGGLRNWRQLRHTSEKVTRVLDLL